MTKANAYDPKSPAMIFNVTVPGSFVEWAAGELHRRGFDRVDPSIIPYIFQEIIDRAFDNIYGSLNLDEAVDAAIDRYDYVLSRIWNGPFPPDDVTSH